MRSPSQNHARATPFRPPLVSFLFAVLWFVSTYQLYWWGQQGWEWGTVAAAPSLFMAITQLIKAVDDRAKLAFHRKKVERFKQRSAPHGKSRLATAADLAKCRFLSRRKGVFLGVYPVSQQRTVDVRYRSRESISAIAPPGQGKTTCLVVPSILGDVGENLIVNDPAGEALAITQDALKAMKYDVKVMTPFPQEVSERLGRKVNDVGLDVFSSFHPKMDPSSIRSQLSRTMKWVCPGKPNMDEKSEFFYRSARSLGGFFALRDMLSGRKPSLPTIRKQLMEGMGDLVETFALAAESNHFGGVYADLARSLRGVLVGASQQFAGAFGVLEQHIDAYDQFSRLGRHTQGGGFNPAALKHPTKKTALFLVSTLDMMQAMSGTTAMTLTYLFDSIAADKQEGACTAIIDECGGLVMPRLPEALEFYRKVNLRCVLIWQDLAGQAEKNYGRAGVQQIMAASQLKIGMGLQEPQTLEMFSKLCGTRAVESMTLNDQSGFHEASPNMSHGQRHQNVPLLRTDDIRRMPDDRLLVVGGNLHPLVLRKLPYWQRPAWRKVANPSPYYQG